MVARAIVAGMRGGELLGLRWSHLEEAKEQLPVKEASYLGHLDTPKTEAGKAADSRRRVGAGARGRLAPSIEAHAPE